MGNNEKHERKEVTNKELLDELKKTQEIVKEYGMHGTHHEYQKQLETNRDVMFKVFFAIIILMYIVSTIVQLVIITKN